jgi:hypothetical protein
MNKNDLDVTVPLTAVPKASAKAPDSAEDGTEPIATIQRGRVASAENKLVIGAAAGTDYATQALAAIAPPPPGPPPGAPPSAAPTTEAATVIAPITLPPRPEPVVAQATQALSPVEVGVKPLKPKSAFDGPREIIPDGRAKGVRNRKRAQLIVASMVVMGVLIGAVIDAVPRIWGGVAIMAGLVSLAMYWFGQSETSK